MMDSPRSTAGLGLNYFNVLWQRLSILDLGRYISLGSILVLQDCILGNQPQSCIVP